MTGKGGAVVVPAAGLGLRMMPATKCVPKELLPLGDRPLIHHVVEEGIEAGADEFIFVVRPGDRRLLDYFSRIPELEAALPADGPGRAAYESTVLGGVRFDAVEQPAPLGLGDAVLCARDRVGERRFAVMLPDMIFEPKRGGLPLLGEIPRRASGILLMEVGSDEVFRYGIADVRDEGTRRRVVDLVEKPAADAAPSNLAVAGRYTFAPELFGFLERTRPGAGGEVQLTDAIRMLAREEEVFSVSLGEAPCHDCGNPAGYSSAFAAFA